MAMAQDGGMQPMKQLEKEDEDTPHSPERTCLATGEAKAKEEMIRFVLDPDGRPVPDLAETLPGRGVWVTATREALLSVIRQQRFSRGFKRKVVADEALVEKTAALMRARLQHWLALANKSGEAVIGFSKVETALKDGSPALLLEASDAGEADAAKLRAHTQRLGIARCALLTREELARPFGREMLVHVAIKPGGIARRMQKEIRRLAGFSRNDPL